MMAHGIVFVGVHYAEGLSRLFQSGLTQRRKTFNVCYGSLADITARPRHVRFTPNNGRWAAHPSIWLSVDDRRLGRRLDAPETDGEQILK
jgi:hypothetical protein